MSGVANLTPVVAGAEHLIEGKRSIDRSIDRKNEPTVERTILREYIHL